MAEPTPGPELRFSLAFLCGGTVVSRVVSDLSAAEATDLAQLIEAAHDLLASAKLAQVAIRETVRRPMGVQPDAAYEALTKLAEAIGKAEGREVAGVPE